MSLYRKQEEKDFTLAIWRIEEEHSFFESKFEAAPRILNDNKRLQWYASRYLLQDVLGEPVEVIKDEAGRPSLKNSEHHISISHTSQFAAVIVSYRYPVGLDIEVINPKVERIAHKFLTEQEVRTIRQEEKIRKLILYWSMKEAMYKFYGETGVEFKTQLLVEQFELRDAGGVKAEIVAVGRERIKLNIRYEFFEGHVLSYIVGR
jgi:4'-phosphopantetheinyl transferase